MAAIMQTTHRQQQGVTLIIVMVMLLLATVVVLGSTRVGWLNEKLVGSESDQQRAFAAAEALVRDAERDIKGLKADNVTACKPPPDYVGCRNHKSGNPFFPEDDSIDLDELDKRIPTTPVITGPDIRCSQGICLTDPTTGLGSTPWDTTKLAAMTATTVAAKYGQYTGESPAAAGNPLLAGNAWYWVEVFRYTTAAGLLTPAQNVPIPDQASPFVYRITAYVQGVRPGTRVWIRSVFVPNPQNQNL